MRIMFGEEVKGWTREEMSSRIVILSIQFMDITVIQWWTRSQSKLFYVASEDSTDIEWLDGVASGPDKSDDGYNSSAFTMDVVDVWPIVNSFRSEKLWSCKAIAMLIFGWLANSCCSSIIKSTIGVSATQSCLLWRVAYLIQMTFSKFHKPVCSFRQGLTLVPERHSQ